MKNMEGSTKENINKITNEKEKIGKIKKTMQVTKNKILNINSNIFPDNWDKAINFSFSNIEKIISEIESSGEKVHWEYIIQKVKNNTRNAINNLTKLKKNRKEGSSMVETIINNGLPTKDENFNINKITPIKNFDGSNISNSLKEIKSYTHNNNNINSPLNIQRITGATFLILLMEELKIRKAKIHLSENNTFTPNPSISDNLNIKEPISQNWYNLQLLLSKITKNMEDEDKVSFIDMFITNGVKSFREKESSSSAIKAISREYLQHKPAEDTFGALIHYRENEIEENTEVLLQLLNSYCSITKISNKGLLKFNREELNFTNILAKNIENQLFDEVKRDIDKKLISPDTSTPLKSMLLLIRNEIITSKKKGETLQEKLEDIYKKIGISFGEMKSHNTTSNKILPFCNITIDVEGTPLEIQIRCTKSNNFKKFLDDKNNKKLFSLSSTDGKEQKKQYNTWKNKTLDSFEKEMKIISGKINEIKERTDSSEGSLKKYYQQKIEKLNNKYLIYQAINSDVNFENIQKEYEETEMILLNYPPKGKNEERDLLLKKGQIKKKIYDETKSWREKFDEEKSNITLINVKEEKKEDFFSKVIYTISDLDHYIYKLKNNFIKDSSILLKKYTNNKQREEQLKLYIIKNIGTVIKMLVEKLFHVGNNELQKNQEGKYAIYKLNMEYKEKLKWVTKIVIGLFIKNEFFNINKYDNKIKKLEFDKKQSNAGNIYEKKEFDKKIKETQDIKKIAEGILDYLENDRKNII